MGIYAELEDILRPVEWIRIKENKKVRDNIKDRSSLKSLIEKTESNQIVIKSADKGDMIVVMSMFLHL